VSAGINLESGAPTDRAPRSGGVSAARIVELIHSRRHESINYNSRLFNTLEGRYQTYRGTWAGDSGQFRNNMSIPFTFAMIQTLVARIVQALFGSWPIVGFEGYGPDDQARAKKSEVLISAQLKNDKSVAKAVDFFLQDAICGTAVLRYGWKNLSRKIKQVRRESVAPGMTIPVVREHVAQMFNGPTWSVIDRLDFWQQPARKYIDDMAWVIHRYWDDWDNLMDDSQGDDPYFDPEAIRLLKNYPLQGHSWAEYNQRKLTFRNEYDYMARQRERFAKPVEIWEMHGLVPDEFAPDGIRHRCIALGNGRVVLKNRPSAEPYVKQFIAYSSMPDPYGFDGIAKAEIASRPQRIANRLANQKLDALDLLIDPMWAMNGSVNINTQNLITRAGRIILADGPVGDDTLRPLSPDMRGFQAAYPEISTVYQYMQLGLGANDILLAQGGGQRETARGYLGRQENTLTRLSLETTLAEQVIEDLANAFRRLDRDLLPLPQEIKILGSLATINPITGLPYQPQSVTVDSDDLDPDYRARAVGPSQMLGRSIRQQNFMGLMQVLSSNPAMMQLVNWANFARQALELFDFKNIDELLVSTVPAINQIASDTGNSPGAIAGAAGTSLEQLDPQVLGQMLNVQQPGQLQGAY
jgi:hypothetical protein